MGQYPNNRPVADFFCCHCNEQFELKSTKSKFGGKITDGAYDSMCRRLAASDNPNLMLLNYDALTQSVANFLVVPKHFFVRTMIEPRKPLSASARRAGWIGCNINLNAIPAAGKIYLVSGGTELPKRDVLAKWKQTTFLRSRSTEVRGWLLDVMKCVDSLQRSEFTIEDVYAFAPELSRLYPGNKHVKEKIRQQLQVLRDNHYLQFTARGRYRVKRTDWLGH
jgi:type II restriction enzyme